jgi:hypothetical protein
MLLMAGGHLRNIQGQSRYDPGLAEVAARYKENLVVFTDRTLYAVNETICFSAFLQSEEKPYLDPGSTVLYLELVNSSGSAVSQGKYPVLENRSVGHLGIPTNLPTGLYYLRAYTRWMRNFGASHFTYIPMRVVNPYSGDASVDMPAGVKNSLSAIPRGPKLVSVSPSRCTYPRGERVEVEFSLEKGSQSRVAHGCISVVPAGALDTTGFRFRLDEMPENSVPFQFNFLPEIHGTSISGIVMEPDNQQPVADAHIHFSILGEEPAYFVTRSDPEGRFVIRTPLRSGPQEMFVVPEYLPGNPAEVRIDNDFASEPLPFHPGIFQLTREEQELASSISLHMQLQGAFLADSGDDPAIQAEGPGSLPFYGNPEISVRIDDFVNLPNLEEVIENLVPKTFVVRRGGGVQLRIDSQNPMISMFPPLVLVDHIPVFDMEVILSIPPSKLDHIDVIPEVYVLGEVKYGGIISFSSLEGDLASIKLPEGSYFFDYLAYESSLKPQAARFEGPARIPDMRNTLFWKEHLSLHPGRSTKIGFQAASIPGTYLILFRGVTSDGALVYGMETFGVE